MGEPNSGTRNASRSRFSGSTNQTDVAGGRDRQAGRQRTGRAKSIDALGRFLSPILWSIIAHGLLVVAMALAKFRSQSKPPRTLTISAGVDAELLDDLPAIDEPILESPEEPQEPSQLQAEPMATPTISDIPLPKSFVQADTTSVDLAEPSLASPIEAISRSDSTTLTTVLSQNKGKKEKRSAVFFGVGATGDSFCFVVDSSRSMRGGKFDVARREVLRVVSAMHPDQQFYVMLFDQNVERMELEPGTPSVRPAKATNGNKQRLAHWIATTKMEPSAKPGKAIEAALHLETDVLFLLTDGELPSDLIANVRAQNREQTGDQTLSPPKVIIHTVGLYSQRGHQLLYQLARENGGRYRFIPRPPR